MCGDRFSSSTTCSRWRHETEPGRLDQSLSCRFWKVATHPFARLLAPEGPEAQPDENTVLAPPTTTTIRRGDVFQLGRHRLACGDATAATDVVRLLAGAHPRLMVTDPHYGVNYQPAFRHQAYPRQRTAVGRVTNDTQADWAAGPMRSSPATSPTCGTRPSMPTW